MSRAKINSATDVSGKENISNKTNTVAGNEASTSFYASIKGVVDYFTTARIRTLLGITTLSGSNTGDQNLSGLEPANANIQAHIASAHAPSNAQKNSDITKAEIEAKVIGEITSHTHPATAQNLAITVRKISTATTLSDTDNGKVILLTASCTVTIPNGLISGFNVTFSTMTGTTLTYALGNLVTLINNTGTTMAEKLTHTIVNTGVANEYLTSGNL